MPYIGNPAVIGDSTNTFRSLDKISSFTLTFDAASTDIVSVANDTLTFRPEVGKMLVFPSWLKHSVYPFDVDGERRSMSFNAYYVSR